MAAESSSAQGSFFLAKCFLIEGLGHCKYINYGVWFRHAQLEKCHEMIFVVNWWYTNQNKELKI